MKIEWHFQGVASSEVIDNHIAHAHALNLPQPQGTGAKRLAVVGGGPSVVGQMEEIKAFDGDIWILGSAYPWATENGIKGTYFNIDPSEDCSRECIGAPKAILGSSVHPETIKALNGADIAVFDLIENGERLNHGVTTATAVPELAIICGYTEIVFYGCESSFNEQFHVGKNLDTDRWLYVKSDGQTFKTRPDYFAQAEFLATIIRAFPQHFKERSGGFLRAMVNTFEWDFTHATRALYQSLNLGDSNGTN